MCVQVARGREREGGREGDVETKRETENESENERYCVCVTELDWRVDDCHETPYNRILNYIL